MRPLKWAALLSAFCVTPTAAHAQFNKAERAEKRIAAIMTEFNEEMRGYERELKFFHDVPEHKSLLDTRNKLVGQSARMTELELSGTGAGPAIRDLAGQMDLTSRELKLGTDRLDQRAGAGAPKEVRRAADKLKAHADRMVKTIDKVVAMFR